MILISSPSKRRLSPKLVALSALVPALVLVSGCGDDEATGAEAPTVVATTGIVAEIAAEVAGPDVEIEQLIPEVASPHDFQLSAQDRAKLDEADLVAASGAGLEAGIPLDETDAQRWDLADHVGELLPFDEGAGDPHVWMDPTRVAAALPSLADTLAELDPDHADEFEERARSFAKELGDLDREVERTLAVIPTAQRKLITSHDSLGYFADRYDFEVLATAFPASGPEAEASAASLGELADAIAASGVPAVFAGEEDDPKALEVVADAAGVAVVDDLAIESLGEAGTYPGMLRHDGVEIANALGE